MKQRGILQGGSRAFSLAETLIALAISSSVGLCAVMMLSGVAAGTRAQNDTREATMRRQVAVARLGAVSRGSARVLARGSDHLVLWVGDVNNDGLPNLSELRRVAWDAEAQQLVRFEAAAGVDPDPAYELSEDFDTITADVAGLAEFPATTLLNRVTGWNVQLDDEADVQAAKLLRLSVTLATASGPEAAVAMASLRATGSTEESP